QIAEVVRQERENTSTTLDAPVNDVGYLLHRAVIVLQPLVLLNEATHPAHLRAGHSQEPLHWSFHALPIQDWAFLQMIPAGIDQLGAEVTEGFFESGQVKLVSLRQLFPAVIVVALALESEIDEVCRLFRGVGQVKFSYEN